MRKNIAFRTWFYFRQGWTTYFAFIFAAVNTLTVTYYLAIERYPQLTDIFPTFLQYVAIVVAIGIPILVLAGYFHYKKTSAFEAEADINIETNPHWRRMLINTDLLVLSYVKLLEIIPKITNQEKLSKEELDELESLKKSLAEQINKKTIN